MHFRNLRRNHNKPYLSDNKRNALRLSEEILMAKFKPRLRFEIFNSCFFASDNQLKTERSIKLLPAYLK